MDSLPSERKIPIVDIDKINYSNIIINKNNFKYNLNELYTNIDLYILIKNINIKVNNYYNNYTITTNNIKMINIRNKLDELLQEHNKKFPEIKFNNLDKRAVYVKFNFLDKISKAYLHPYKSGIQKTSQTILVKSFEDFIKSYNDYYKIGANLSADIIFKVYTTGYNNFVSFGIYDIDISPMYYSKNIIKRNISYQSENNEISQIII